MPFELGLLSPPDLPVDSSVPTPPPRDTLPRWYHQTIRDSRILPPDSTLEGPRRSAQLAPHASFASLFTADYIAHSEPKSWQEAIEHPQWRDAMEKELDSIDRNETWTLVDRPRHKKVIGTKWIFRTKLKADGTLDKYKARLVVQGFQQKHGIDYEETFAPTARMTSFRLLVALAAHHGWPLHQMDVKSAFLNGYLEEEVYVEQPLGFPSANRSNKVFHLRKALYGLKQASKSLFQRMDEFLQTHGYHSTPYDPNLYVHTTRAGVSYILIYGKYCID